MVKRSKGDFSVLVRHGNLTRILGDVSPSELVDGTHAFSRLTDRSPVNANFLSLVTVLLHRERLVGDVRMAEGEPVTLPHLPWISAWPDSATVPEPPECAIPSD